MRCLEKDTVNETQQALVKHNIINGVGYKKCPYGEFKMLAHVDLLYGAINIYNKNKR